MEPDNKLHVMPVKQPEEHDRGTTEPLFPLVTNGPSAEEDEAAKNWNPLGGRFNHTGSSQTEKFQHY